MSVEASRIKAMEASQRLAKASGDAAEVLRGQALAFFGEVPEPPVYRRRDDPVRAKAASLIGDAERLLAMAYQTNDVAWTRAIDAHLVVLHDLAEGRVEHAEVSWAEAQRLEAEAAGRRRLFSSSDERRAPVFDSATRQSRFDPQPERSVTAKVPCPSCRKVSELSFSPRLAHHAFSCTSCATKFDAYFAEVRASEVRRSQRGRTYVFRLKELDGPQTRLEVEDRSVGELQVARNDLLAFLYAPRGVLRGVLNLNSSRVLWVTPGGPCFIATVAFGEGSSELSALRRFRDVELRPWWLGRRFIEIYYAVGPALAALVVRVPGLRALVRSVLGAVVRRLPEALR